MAPRVDITEKRPVAFLRCREYGSMPAKLRFLQSSWELLPWIPDNEPRKREYTRQWLYDNQTSFCNSDFFTEDQLMSRVVMLGIANHFGAMNSILDTVEANTIGMDPNLHPAIHLWSILVGHDMRPLLEIYDQAEHIDFFYALIRLDPNDTPPNYTHMVTRNLNRFRSEDNPRTWPAQWMLKLVEIWKTMGYPEPLLHFTIGDSLTGFKIHEEWLTGEEERRDNAVAVKMAEYLQERNQLNREVIYQKSEQTWRSGNLNLQTYRYAKELAWRWGIMRSPRITDWLHNPAFPDNKLFENSKLEQWVPPEDYKNPPLDIWYPPDPKWAPRLEGSTDRGTVEGGTY